MLQRRTPLALFLTMSRSDRPPKVLCGAGACQAVLCRAKRWWNKAVNGAYSLLSITLDSIDSLLGGCHSKHSPHTHTPRVD